MSFGFGAGDFIAIIKLAHKVRRDFAGAPDQFQQITAEIRNLAIILQDVDIFFIKHEITKAEKDSLRDIRESCRRVLEDTQMELNKYSSLTAKYESRHERAKRVWERLQWEPNEVRDLRSRITSHIMVLNSHIMSQVRNNVAKIVELQAQQQNIAILNWLTPMDPDTEQSFFVRQRQAGTGQWLIDLPEYTNWKATRGEAIFCHGIPGAGKTIMSSIVVEDLQETFYTKKEKDVAVCFFYCNFQRRNEQGLKDIILSFLKQLLQAVTALPECVKELFDRCQAKRTQPTLEEATRTLRSVAELFRRVFVVVDALDECQTSDGCRKELMSELIELNRVAGINILATSRPVPHVVENLQDFLSVEIRATKGDIRRFVSGNIHNLPAFVGCNPGLLSEIMNSIVEAVDGMFLLAKLHLDSLMNKRSPRTLRKTLTTLAAGSNAYTKAYQSTMERILRQSEDQKEVAIQTLMWVVYARRPLTTTELQHALSIEIGKLEFLEDNIPDLQYIVSACHGLLTVDQDSSIIRLAHYTTQEFFETQEFRYFPGAQTKITDTCLTYLSFPEFDSGPCQLEQDLEIKLARFALYEYSSYHWGHHAKCQKEFESVRCFLDQPHHVEASGQVLLVYHSQNSSSKQRPTKVTAFHLVAYFGLSAVVKATTLKREDTDVQDSHCRTPLSYAAANGHDGVVRILLDWNAQLDVPDTDGQTPLLWATRNGHGAIVRLLLDGNAQVDTSDTIYNQTPLLWAAKNGHETIVQMLLDSNAQVDAPDTRYGQIPPSWAIRYGQTPLLWAIKDGRDAIVRMLLDKNAQTDIPDRYGRTPLSWASELGHEAIVHMLLDRKAHFNVADAQGRTPLSWAADQGHEAIVHLFLTRVPV
ncbi:hypothetical protein AB5N19_12486 [Seiridium cardinale]